MKLITAIIKPFKLDDVREAIANLGVEFLRMDAVAFIWKQMGTPCENLPQAHNLLRAGQRLWLSDLGAASFLPPDQAGLHARLRALAASHQGDAAWLRQTYQATGNLHDLTRAAADEFARPSSSCAQA